MSIRSPGLGSSPALAQDGAIVFIDLYGDLLYARPVANGTGTCGTNLSYECETIPTVGVPSNPSVVVDPGGDTYRLP